MIKLKSLTEEKEAFVKEREGKIQFNIEELYNSTIIRLYSDEGEIGHCEVKKDVPFKDLNSMPPKPNYLFIHRIGVWVDKYQGKGYGYLLYREAVKYAKQIGLRGLVSSKIHRSDKATEVWDKLKTFSDRDYDYVDI